MKTENWVKDDVLKDYQKRAMKSVEDREKWEKEQIKKGKKKVYVSHPEIDKTFIIKFV
jgi:hypothetical protein